VKIAALLHAADPVSLARTVPQLLSGRKVGALIVTAKADLLDEAENVCRAAGLRPEALTFIDNRGCDVLGLLDALPLLRQNGCEIALNITTGLFPVWSSSGAILTEGLPEELHRGPLLDSAHEAARLFEHNADVALIGPADLYQSAQHQSGSETARTALLQKIAPAADPAQKWGFFAGRGFWFRPSTFVPLIDLREFLVPGVDRNSPDRTEAAFARAMEQIIGLWPRLAGKKTWLAYAEGSANETSIVPAEETRCPAGLPYCLTTIFEGYRNSDSDARMLSEQRDFDRTFYSRYFTTGESPRDAIRHYLRYGAYEGCNPNAEFDSAWYWEEHRDVLESGINPFVHYLREGKAQGRTVFPAADNIVGCMERVAETDLFDSDHYLRAGRLANVTGDRVLEHFCTDGWKDARPPCSGRQFDPVWYQSEYLHEWRHPINPLLHYAVSGKRRKLLPRPEAPSARKHASRLPERSIRRACLFAAFDPDSVVDECVVSYMRELARHSEVFFLADCTLTSGELDKLSSFTSGAWSFPHGEYDFGSYKRLAGHLVGWDRLRQYDEVLLVNDSAYLLRQLDDVFQKMQRQECNWWGLQGTKGVFATRHVPTNRFPRKIPFEEVVGTLLAEYEQEARYDFLMGSYFLAFRQPAFDELSRMLESVRRERFKKNVIYKYEVNLTRRLILAGHAPGSFMHHLYPFHPVYTENHFDMIEDGFPLLKRVLLTENNYRVPQLSRWSERLRKVLPDLDVALIERHLARICSPEKLRANLSVPGDAGFFVPANREEAAGLS